jgi:hypothetical protein
LVEPAVSLFKTERFPLRNIMAEYHLTPEDIPVGTPLPWSVFDGQGKLLLHKGYVIHRPITVASLFAQSVCRVGIDSPEESVAVPTKPQSPPSICPFDALSEQAQRLEQLLENPETFDGWSHQVLSLAHDLQLACEADSDAALGFIPLDIPLNYFVKHSIDTAIVCEIVGISLQESPEIRRSIIAAALSMNLCLFSELRHQRPCDSPPETEPVQTHEHHQKLLLRLQQLGVSDSTWLQIVALTSKIFDGKEFSSHGFQVDEFSLEARLLQLANQYTVGLHPCAYRQSLASYQILRDIFLESKRGNDPALGGYFIKTLGVYPLGFWVKLNNGEIGVVIHRTANPSSPIVMSFKNWQQMPLRIPLKRDTLLPIYRISAILNMETNPVDPYMLWGYLPFKAQEAN